MTSIITFGIIILYFLPMIMAIEKKQKNKTAIIVLNILLGWTLVGWVIALIWAVKKD